MGKFSKEKKWIHIGKAEIGKDCNIDRNCKNYNRTDNPVICCGPKDKGKCKDTNKCDYKERLPTRMERRKGLRKMIEQLDIEDNRQNLGGKTINNQKKFKNSTLFPSHTLTLIY